MIFRGGLGGIVNNLSCVNSFWGIFGKKGAVIYLTGRGYSRPCCRLRLLVISFEKNELLVLNHPGEGLVSRFLSDFFVPTFCPVSRHYGCSGRNWWSLAGSNR